MTNSDSQAITSFNDALRPSAFEVSSISDPQSKSFDKTYSYYADGLLKLAENGLEGHQRFDRPMTYDFAGRTKSVRTGIEAHGETETELTNLPFRQDYSYNAFGNLTGRESTLWNYTNGSWDFEYEMVNNRDINAGYDADGRQTVVAEANSTGDKGKRMVLAGGEVIAYLTYRPGGIDTVHFRQTDALGISERITRSSPENLFGVTINEPNYIDPRHMETDPMGGNVGTVTSHTPVYLPVNTHFPPIEGDSPVYINGQQVRFSLDGVAMSSQVAIGRV